MSWTYRIAKVTYKSGEVLYDVREYYEPPDGPTWTAQAVRACGDDIDDLIQELRRQLLAAEKAKKYPALILNLNGRGDAT